MKDVCFQLSSLLSIKFKYIGVVRLVIFVTEI